MEIINITKSRTREALLRLFFLDSEKKYYLRELERILDISATSIRRELLSLEKSGIFEREKAGKQIYYFLNKKSVVYDDLKNIVFKTIGIEGVLKKEISEVMGIKRSFIFGSIAKNKQNTLSDIDLMIIGDVDEDVLIKRISKVEGVLKREINYHLFDEKEWEEGQKENSFLMAIVEGPKIEIV
jgi:predicted nucleotidyltransferase